jgi:cell division protein FtsZ
MENLESGLEFDLPKNKSSIIKVIGVGGGGSNAVNHMKRMGINGVDFIVCNTDQQALEHSPVENQIQLGVNLTEGMGAGANPDVGRQAAEETLEEVRDLLRGSTKMVFITAGMGGGTGTGAAPVIARCAKEMGILTVGIVTKPFNFEGKVREKQAQQGIELLRQHVDSLIVINNDKLREVYGNLSFRSGFAKADEVLATAAKGIAEVITYHFTANIDLRDVRTVLENSGTAIMGSAIVGGPNRAKETVMQALDSPLLNDNHIRGSKNVLLMIVSSGGDHEITMDEMSVINEHIQEEAGGDTNVIMGIGINDDLDDKIHVTVIATGFPANQHEMLSGREPEKIVHSLNEDQPISKNIFEKPFKKVEEPGKTESPKTPAQPDLFSALPAKDAIVHRLDEELMAPIGAAISAANNSVDIEVDKPINELQKEVLAEVKSPSTKNEEEETTVFNLDEEEEVLAEAEPVSAEIEEEETTVFALAEDEVEDEIETPVEEEVEEPEMILAMREEPELVIEEEDEAEAIEDAELTISEMATAETEIANEVVFEFNAEAASDLESLWDEEDEDVVSEVEELEAKETPAFAMVNEDDELTFELDDIDGEGIYLAPPVAQKAPVAAEETSYDPFDMRIESALNEREPKAEKQQPKAEKIEEPLSPSPKPEGEKRIVHTLEDLRELEQKLQIKKPTQDEPIAAPKIAASIPTPAKKDESQPFEVKIKEPANAQQEPAVDEDFLNRPLTPAAWQKIMERKARLEAFSYTFKHAHNTMLEREPAYKRQGVAVANDNYSNQSSIGRMMLSGSASETEIKTNNSFLHDNVD